MTEFGSKEYFRELKQGKKDIDQAAQDSLRPHEVLEMGHEVPLDSISSRTRVAQLARLAMEHGWAVKIGSSRYRSADKLAKSSGNLTLGREEVWLWLDAIKGGNRVEYSANTCRFNGADIDYTQMRIEIETA